MTTDSPNAAQLRRDWVEKRALLCEASSAAADWVFVGFILALCAVKLAPGHSWIAWAALAVLIAIKVLCEILERRDERELRRGDSL